MLWERDRERACIMDTSRASMALCWLSLYLCPYMAYHTVACCRAIEILNEVLQDWNWLSCEVFHLHWSLILPTHIIWFSPSVPLLLAAAHHSLFLLIQNKPIYRSVTVSRWMIATQHLIYGYVLLYACVLDILCLRPIFPVSCSDIMALLYSKSFYTHVVLWIDEKSTPI